MLQLQGRPDGGLEEQQFPIGRIQRLLDHLVFDRCDLVIYETAVHNDMCAVLNALDGRNAPNCELNIDISGDQSGRCVVAVMMKLNQLHRLHHVTIEVR
jgi:hypothetical protein